jgi:hypothetical protein
MWLQILPNTTIEIKKIILVTVEELLLKIPGMIF